MAAGSVKCYIGAIEFKVYGIKFNNHLPPLAVLYSGLLELACDNVSVHVFNWYFCIFFLLILYFMFITCKTKWFTVNRFPSLKKSRKSNIKASVFVFKIETKNFLEENTEDKISMEKSLKEYDHRRFC